jgi:hypothetical protein
MAATPSQTCGTCGQRALTQVSRAADMRPRGVNALCELGGSGVKFAWNFDADVMRAALG